MDLFCILGFCRGGLLSLVSACVPLLIVWTLAVHPPFSSWSVLLGEVLQARTGSRYSMEPYTHSGFDPGALWKAPFRTIPTTSLEAIRKVLQLNSRRFGRVPVLKAHQDKNKLNSPCRFIPPYYLPQVRCMIETCRGPEFYLYSHCVPHRQAMLIPLHPY